MISTSKLRQERSRRAKTIDLLCGYFLIEKNPIHKEELKNKIYSKTFELYQYLLSELGKFQEVEVGPELKVAQRE